MKNHHFLFSLLFLASGNAAFAQEPITFNVVYEFRYVRDLMQKENPYTTNMILSIGKNTSRYCTEKLYKDNDKNSIRDRKKQQDQQQISSKPTTTVVGGPMLLVGKAGVAIQEEVIKDISKRKLETIGRIAFKTYFTTTDLPVINWVLQNEKKMIGKYTCQKAVGSYAGRVYEAWFTPDLPISDGPWKLSGLPGLILEAHDAANEVVFAFKEMNRNEDIEETVSPFLKDQFSIKTSIKEYNRARAAFDTDPESIILASFPDAKIHVRNTDVPDNKQVIKIKKYNPIELD